MCHHERNLICKNKPGNALWYIKESEYLHGKILNGHYEAGGGTTVTTPLEGLEITNVLTTWGS